MTILKKSKAAKYSEFDMARLLKSKKAMTEYIRKQEEKANQTLESSPQYRRWLDNVDPQAKREILRQGAIQYLLSEEE